MTMRYFTGTEADEAGIPFLHVGTDVSLDESHPVIALHGQGLDGAALFSHLAVSLGMGDLNLLLRDMATADQHDTNRVVAGDRRELRAVLERAVTLARQRHRLQTMLGLLDPGEHVQLRDAGSTRVTVEDGGPGVGRVWEVTRWGGKVGRCRDVWTALGLALYDLGLQYTSDPLVAERVAR